MQHQDTHSGPNHRLDGSSLTSYTLSQRQQQPELLQSQQQQHYHQQQQGTAYPPSLPPASNHLPSQHNSHSLSSHPSALLQQQQQQQQHPHPHPHPHLHPHPHPQPHPHSHSHPHPHQNQHPAVMSSPQLPHSSHLAAYAPYPPSLPPAMGSPQYGLYTCPEIGCQKQFTDMENYRIHAQSDHRSSTNIHPSKDSNQHIPENSKQHVCEHPGCGRAFRQYGNLKTHVRKHTGERPYQCNFEGCGKNFAQLGNLKTHEKIHWPVKPYVCDYPDCRRGFTQRGNLKAHLIKVHHVTSS